MKVFWNKLTREKKKVIRYLQPDDRKGVWAQEL